MSTSAVSSTTLHQELQQYFHLRQNDVQQLGQALNTGDLAGAQSAYSKIVALGKNGPFGGGEPFQINQREQNFAAVGQALQAGDLAGAQQAFSALKSTFHGAEAGGGGPGGTLAQPGPGSAGSSGPEIILNLSNGSTNPEQITINISNPASGGEQVSLSVGSQGSNAQQVTFNLPSNSNEQIVLNLLGASSPTGGSSSSSTTSGSPGSGGISVSA